MDNKNHTTFFVLIKAVKNVNKNKAVKPSKKMYITEHRLQKNSSKQTTIIEAPNQKKSSKQWRYKIGLVNKNKNKT